jgi:hypothetical protein
MHMSVYNKNLLFNMHGMNIKYFFKIYVSHMHNEGKYLSDDIACMIHVIIKQTLKKYIENFLPLDIFKSVVKSLKNILSMHYTPLMT